MSDQKTMKAPAWDLESIFPGGSKSKEYTDFRKKIAEDMEKAKKVLEKLPDKLDGDGPDKWAAWILEMQRIYEHIHLSSALAGCLVCQDVSDSLAHKIDVEIDRDGLGRFFQRAVSTDIQAGGTIAVETLTEFGV